MTHSSNKPFPVRTLGRTGFRVSALGLGAGPLGDHSISDREAEDLVRYAIDLGITLIDTAPSYGASEERIGRALVGRRHEVTLVTKGGYGVPGVGDWTDEVIARGVDLALRRLKTDHIDVFLLHSCGLERISRMIEPLLHAKASGKIGAIGYSGDGAPLAWAIACGDVDVVECSVNLVDQAALARTIPDAQSRGIGVIAKRALANAPWSSAERPARDDAAIYWDRWRTRGLYGDGDGHTTEREKSTEAWDELAVRFAAFAPGVSTALVGTRSQTHLKRAADYVARGLLPGALVSAFTSGFPDDWAGVV